MRRNDFERFLYAYIRPNGEHLTDNAIATRLTNAGIAEEILERSLDQVVDTDGHMLKALDRLAKDARERNGGLQNSVRKYYEMVNGRQFPRRKTVREAR